MHKDDLKNQEDNMANVEKNRNLFKKYLLFFAVCFGLLASYFIGYDRGKKPEAETVQSVPLGEAILQNRSAADQSVDFSLFWKVWDIVKEKHIDNDELDAQEMVYGSINGMLKATGDPYSYFFDPEESRKFSEDIEGSFEGIGAELGIKDDILTIIAPLEDSPAQKAGLLAGDKIFKVDDKIAADFTIDQAVDLIRGKKGTSVTLTILRAGEQETREVVVTRDKIEIMSVKLEFKENNIAHIKLTKFVENTDKEFNQAVNAIIKAGAKGIILDLRNNPGGLLDKSIDVASRMIRKGDVVVTEEDGAGKTESIETVGGDALSAIPTVVLINEGSASAAEILAGALKDNRGLTLIGKKSFGKGSVQQLISLPNGSSVKITVAKWLTPSGKYIMDEGIAPDVEVDLTLDDYENKRDPQLDKAVEIIKEQIK